MTTFITNLSIPNSGMAIYSSSHLEDSLQDDAASKVDSALSPLDLYFLEDDIWSDHASTVEPPQTSPDPCVTSEYHDSLATQAHRKTWNKLPYEITENIIEWLGRRDLRSCRLVDRSTNSAATRVLFRTICISPSVNSIARLFNISLQPALANLVRVIEVQTHYLVDMPFHFFTGFNPLAQHLQRLQPLDAAIEALSLSRAYQLERAAEVKFPTDGPAMLSAALKKLTRLQHFVHTRPSSRVSLGNYLLDHDSDLVRRTGVAMLDCGNQHPLMNSVLQKSRHVRPLSLDFTSLYWWEFYNISAIPHLKELFTTVTDFKLTFQVESFDRPRCRLNQTNSHWRNGLTRYIEQLSSLLPVVENLWLGFDNLPAQGKSVQSPCIFAQQRMSALFFRLKEPSSLYAKLKSLTLENMSTNRKELCEFILPHASTLKSLAITNMCLDGSQTPGPNGGVMCSMIRTTTFLHQNLNLDTMSYLGTFRDHHGRSLMCSPKGEQSLLHRIQEYICHRKPLPFKARTAKKSAEGQIDGDTMATGDVITMRRPVNGLNVDLKVESDESWCVRGASSVVDS